MARDHRPVEGPVQTESLADAKFQVGEEMGDVIDLDPHLSNRDDLAVRATDGTGNRKKQVVNRPATEGSANVLIGRPAHQFLEIRAIRGVENRRRMRRGGRHGVARFIIDEDRTRARQRPGQRTQTVPCQLGAHSGQSDFIDQVDHLEQGAVDGRQGAQHVFLQQQSGGLRFQLRLPVGAARTRIPTMIAAGMRR